MFLRERFWGEVSVQESLLKSFKFERLQLSRGFSETHGATHVSGRGVRVSPSSENQETLPFRVVFLFELVNGTRIGLQYKKNITARVHEKGTSFYKKNITAKGTRKRHFRAARTVESGDNSSPL